jgi:hypothetical protein
MNGIEHHYILQARDVDLLRAVAKFRVIDREQAKTVAGFGSTTRINARLLALRRMDFLRSVVVGSSGAGHKRVYILTRKGAAVADVEYRRVRLFEDNLIGADLGLEHQMTLNSTYLSLVKTPSEIRVGNWRTFDESLSPQIKLKPDGYFEYSSDRTRAAFLEVDMGTERRKIWRRKVDEYLRLATSQEFIRIFGQSQFRTLIVASGERSLKTILGTISERTEKIFFGTTIEKIQRQSFWSSIWFRPGKSDQVTLC